LNIGNVTILNFKVWRMENREKIRKVVGPVPVHGRVSRLVHAYTRARRRRGGSATAHHLALTLLVDHCPGFLAVHVHHARRRHYPLAPR
jgi:hypothetical protein